VSWIQTEPTEVVQGDLTERALEDHFTECLVECFGLLGALFGDTWQDIE
jgi:hypothetical protein